MTTDDSLQRSFDEAPLHGLIGDFAIQRTADGVRIAGAFGAAAENGEGSGVTHGGAVATLLDASMTFALIAATDHDWTTVDLRLDYLRPAPLAGVVAAGVVVQAGRRIGRAEGALRSEDGTVLARAVGTFAALDTPAP